VTQSLDRQIATAARTGDLDVLMELVSQHPSEDEAFLLYKWLNVASDFGHDEADELVESLLNSELHAADDQFVSGQAHLELATAYLTGRDHLEIDFDRGRTHVHEMRARSYPDGVQDAAQLLDNARAGMSPGARAVFDRALTEPLIFDEDDDES
jgi:hypothetical protein